MCLCVFVFEYWCLKKNEKLKVNITPELNVSLGFGNRELLKSIQKESHRIWLTKGKRL